MIRACVVLGLVLSLVAWPLAVSVQADDDGGPLRAALDARLDPDASRPVPRLPQVAIDPSGDATVIFAIRSENDDASATRDGALLDTLTILRTVYGPSISGLTTATVLGTFPFKGTKGKSVREGVVLRAVLSADRAALVDWDRLAPSDVPGVVDAWWMQGAFANVDAAPPVAPAAQSSPEDDLLASRVPVAIAHLDEALVALDAADVRIGRSQFKQFFDVWDELDETVARLYPDQYSVLDVDLEHAEFALLHTQPEDVPTARSALSGVRASLIGLGAAVQP